MHPKPDKPTPRLKPSQHTAIRAGWRVDENGVKYIRVKGVIQHQHAKLRADLKLSPEFVIHSLRHTCLTRLGLAGVDPFRIKKIAGHCSISVSEKYVHPSPESQERAFELLDALNAEMLNETTKGVTGSVTKSDPTINP